MFKRFLEAVKSVTCHYTLLTVPIGLNNSSPPEVIQIPCFLDLPGRGLLYSYLRLRILEARYLVSDINSILAL
jgi:hypothetical protein